MLRYRLDDLGWFEFEGLCQTLLKARLGLGVEAWGRSGDWGRDAYCPDPLKYPGDSASDGPFIFQCKFVEAANAAGAKPTAAIVDAVQKECRRITERKSAVLPRYRPIRHYSLFTNASLNAAAREKLQELLNDALSSECSVHIHDGNDLCAWLDLSNEVVRAFPQIWSLRRYEEILRQYSLPDVLTRSAAALDEAAEIASLFVPTQTYSKALEIVTRHRFVVLEGPPEMGKTAIGRMIALSGVARGWEALECRGPIDVERAYVKDRRQIFVADDFFGRTEYDSERVSEWQREIKSILRILDDSHWLVLTSRAHLLNLAKQGLDLEGSARRFPQVGEVVVDAASLTPLEKARILYRHAKHGNLELKIRTVLRRHGHSISADPHFTPERIRRLVSDVLPRVDVSGVDEQIALRVLQAARDVISDPTRSMEISFRKLRASEQWLLFSMLDENRKVVLVPEREKLAETYVRLCPDDSREPFDEVLGALSNAFIRFMANGTPQWVHPSCRDLAILSLRRDRASRQRFLARCGLAGIALSLSCGGGKTGDLDLPLIVEDEDWAILGSRIAAIDVNTIAILDAISEALRTALQLERLQGGSAIDRLKELVFSVGWPALIDDLNSTERWNVTLLSRYLSAGGPGAIPSRLPELGALWRGINKAALDVRNNPDISGCVPDMVEFVELAEIIRKAGLKQYIRTFDADVGEIAQLWAREFEERSGEVDVSDWDEEHPESGFHQIAASCTELADLTSDTTVQERLYALSGGFEEIAGDYVRKDQPEPEPDWDRDDVTITREEDREMPIARLFEDL